MTRFMSYPPGEVLVVVSSRFGSRLACNDLSFSKLILTAPYDQTAHGLPKTP